MTTEQHRGADFASVAHARIDALEARQELADIIDKLAAKADIKTRLGRQVRTHQREVTVTAATVGAMIAAAVGLLLWRARRSPRGTEHAVQLERRRKHVRP